VALRVAPFAGPFREDDATARAIVDLAKQILDEAHSHDVKIEEFQLDFDCAQNNLRDYRGWLRTLRGAVHPVRFVITTLPSWLDYPDFLALIREAVSYVLHVLSIPLSSTRVTLCDARSAQQWISKAANLGLPVSIATDMRNWRWVTLSAVMAGRSPEH